MVKQKDNKTFIDNEELLSLFDWPDKNQNGMQSYRYYNEDLTFQRVICLRKKEDHLIINWTETQMRGFKTTDLYQIEIKKNKIVSKNSTFTAFDKYKNLLNDIKVKLKEMNVKPVFYFTGNENAYSKKNKS